MKLDLETTEVFAQNYDAYKSGIRITVDQGGTRSSKTYSLAQLFLIILLEQRNCVLTVCRKTLPSLKSSAMRDFYEVLETNGLYRVENHNKSDLTYTYKTNEIEFISIDQAQKIRGRKRQYLWMNEANEFSYEDFRQLNLRTERQIFMDYNPSDEFHWIYDHILTRPETDMRFIKSTYKDNTFLPAEIIKEIELLKETDQNYWRIYGLGERGVSGATIYTHWDYCEDLPENPDETIFGLDFGFNNKTALVRIDIKDDEDYTKELLYESHLTNSELIERMKKMVEDGLMNYSDPIYADAAEPQRIQEINDAGFNCISADKDVEKGIDTVRTRKWHITKDSVNMVKEVRSYKWKMKGEEATDDPVKFNDHLMDARRYASHSHQNQLTPQIHII